MILAKIITTIYLGYFSFFNFDALANQRKNPFGGASVNVHKREDKHIKTAALICLLVEMNASLSELKIVLFDQFPKTINDSDKFLIVDTMSKMCPIIDPKNIIEEVILHLDENFD